MNLEFHELANLFPLMEGREFDDLVTDIELHGCREPIYLLDGKILDGRNRWRACEKIGARPTLVDYEGDDAAAFVISLNLHRRHLSESQRMLVAGKLANLRDGQRADQAAQTCAPVTQSAAAEMLNVSRRGVQLAREVIDRGSPDLVAAVEQGRVSVSAAADVSSLPKGQQSEIVARGEKEIVATANKIRAQKKVERKAERVEKVAKLAAKVAPASDRYQIYLQPCSSLVELPPESVDWVITDPPYPREFLSVYDDLAIGAAHVLKPGGSLLCMVGHSYLPDVIRSLEAGLLYHWTLAYLVPGGQATQIFPRKINTFWKPVLWFVKGGYAGDWIGDTTRSDVNDNDKTRHHWGQSESGMRDLMRRFVKPGDTVLDPFMGAGTTGVVALDLGATFIGLDIDQGAYNETLARFADASMVA